jgi:hypothetical protein
LYGTFDLFPLLWFLFLNDPYAVSSFWVKGFFLSRVQTEFCVSANYFLLLINLIISNNGVLAAHCPEQIYCCCQSRGKTGRCTF